ncbi:uncharacterized protein BDR25DRAFT_349332 [Lindgomyces ingoldianus]|uniref:Uncharacterized protein n=1 Tax=Lindgomyces ingoldianus TaxID=673940 RepID=A0ACB6RAJ7_9PLEO|nr:uncharacterized protein BDR25DRAFT_349332 [Lindgomyces ingoldianus]KAF2476206.1 hypothetical protein BDR25DRAFT_349332 [Lindgomyces ingoldianus]
MCEAAGKATWHCRKQFNHELPLRDLHHRLQLLRNVEAYRSAVELPYCHRSLTLFPHFEYLQNYPRREEASEKERFLRRGHMANDSTRERDLNKSSELTIYLNSAVHGYDIA